MKQIITLSSMALLTVLLVACGGKKPVETAPEVVSPIEQPKVISHAVGNPAVMAIWERAESSRAAGDIEGAISHLERAIRINPDDPIVWTRMAELRLKQGKYVSAENIAIKSNNLNGGANQVLAYRNWLIIAKARENNGDDAGAQEAKAQASALR